MCVQRAMGGYLDILKWAREMDALGIHRPVHRLWKGAIWRFCDGQRNRAAYKTLGFFVCN